MSLQKCRAGGSYPKYRGKRVTCQGGWFEVVCPRWRKGETLVVDTYSEAMWEGRRCRGKVYQVYPNGRRTRLLLER